MYSRHANGRIQLFQFVQHRIVVMQIIARPRFNDGSILLFRGFVARVNVGPVDRGGLFQQHYFRDGAVHDHQREQHRQQSLAAACVDQHVAIRFWNFVWQQDVVQHDDAFLELMLQTFLGEQRSPSVVVGMFMAESSHDVDNLHCRRWIE